MKKDNEAKDAWKKRGEAEISALREALKRNPKDPAALMKLGAALLRTWSEPERVQGRKYLEKAAKLNKDFPAPVEELALDASMDDHVRAVRLYKKAAEIYRRKGDGEKADKLLNRAATLINDEGWEAREQGDDSAAKKKALKALEVYPYCVDARNLLGNIYTDRFEFFEAEKVYCTAVDDAVREQGGVVKMQDAPYWLEMDTRPYMRARHGLGLSLMQLHRYEEALREFEILMDLNPNDNQGVRFLLGDVYHFTGNLEKAEQCYREYEDVESRYGHALLQNFLGKEATASAMLIKCLKGAPFIARILRLYLEKFDFWKERGLFRYGDLPLFLLHRNAMTAAWNEMLPNVTDRQAYHDFESAYQYCALNATLWLKYEGSQLFLQKAMDAAKARSR
jgi:tetratricopeptide (TPR) repeat protein